MPFCPKCKYEYRSEIKKCPDCEVALVDELPVPVEETPVVLDNPVVVGTFLLAMQAVEAKLKLESFGIKVALSNEILNRTTTIIAVDQGVEVLVSEEDALKAIEILESD